MNKVSCSITALMVAASAATAQEPTNTANPVQSVQITASADRQRQADTTGKVVVNRADIVRFGDTSVADVLRRLPGVTVSGEIRMRGLGDG